MGRRLPDFRGIRSYDRRTPRDGFDLVDPGLVTIDQWNPDNDQRDLPAESIGTWLYGAVGRKP